MKFSHVPTNLPKVRNNLEKKNKELTFGDMENSGLPLKIMIKKIYCGLVHIGKSATNLL